MEMVGGGGRAESERGYDDCNRGWDCGARTKEGL